MHDRRAVYAQLLDAFTDLSVRLGLGCTPDQVITLDRWAMAAADRMTTALLSDDHGEQAQAVIDTGLVVHGDHEVPGHWWRTPVGRVCAASLAGAAPTDEAVTQAAAAEILGVSQPAVHKMLTAGRLDRHPDGGVLLHSVMWRLAQNGPTETPGWGLERA